MRVLHLECSSGISGDMWLGALVGAGASLEAVQEAVAAVGVGDVRITLGRVRRAGVQATSVKVRAPQETPSVRRWPQIRDLIAYAALDDDVRTHALSAFARLADALAHARGVDVDDVTFHEVGALDTIADIVGACAALASLNVARVTCGPVAIGGGTARTTHGVVPVPDPAVTWLLTGFPVRGGDVDVELATPTGAALLAEFAAPVRSLPPMTLGAVGVGAGAADLDHPNVLRAFLGQSTDGDPR